MEEVLNKDTFIGFFGLLLFLAVFLNLFLLALVLWPLNRHASIWPFHRLLPLCPLHLHPVVTRWSPKHVVMVGVCVSNLLAAFLHHSLVLHFYSSRDEDGPPPVTCSAVVTSELSAYVFPALTRVLVAAVLVSETQKMTSLDDVKNMMTACVLMMVAAMYACGVLVPVFFFLYLAFATEPCYPGKTILRYTTDSSDGKVLSVLSYILPVVFIVSSLSLLIFTYFWKKARDKSFSPGVPAKHHHSVRIPNSSPKEIHSNGAPVFSPPFNKRGGTEMLFNKPKGNHGFSSDRSSNDRSPSSGLTSKTLAFPYDSLFAAVFAVVLEFVFCVRQFAYWDQVDDRLMSTKQWIHLWAADRFLSLLSLSVIPCCWFFDPYVRDFFQCCRNVAGPVSPQKVDVKCWTNPADLREQVVSGGGRNNSCNEESENIYQNLPDRNGDRRSQGMENTCVDDWEREDDDGFLQSRDRSGLNTNIYSNQTESRRMVTKNLGYDEGNTSDCQTGRNGHTTFPNTYPNNKTNTFNEQIERSRNASHRDIAERDDEVFNERIRRQDYDRRPNSMQNTHSNHNNNVNSMFPNQTGRARQTSSNQEAVLYENRGRVDEIGGSGNNRRMRENSYTGTGRGGMSQLQTTGASPQSMPGNRQQEVLSADRRQERQVPLEELRWGVTQNRFNQSKHAGSGNANAYGRDENVYGRDANAYGRNANAYGRDENVCGRDANAYGRDGEKAYANQEQLGREGVDPARKRGVGQQRGREDMLQGQRTGRGGQVFSVPRRGVEQNPYNLSDARSGGENQIGVTGHNRYTTTNERVAQNTFGHNNRTGQNAYSEDAVRGGSGITPKREHYSNSERVGGMGQKSFGEQRMVRGRSAERSADPNIYEGQNNKLNGFEEGGLTLGRNRFRSQEGGGMPQGNYPEMEGTGRGYRSSGLNDWREDKPTQFRLGDARGRYPGYNPESEC